MIAIMADSTRNFRSYYYSKVGYSSVDERKTIEKILQEDALNINKIKEFGYRFTFPSTYRLFVWKVLLNVLSRHKSSHESIWKDKYEHFKFLFETIEMLGMSTNKPRHIAYLHMFLSVQLLSKMDFESQETDPSSLDFIAVAKVFEKIVDDLKPDDRLTPEMIPQKQAEVYWLTRNFVFEMRKNHEHFPNLKDTVESVLQKKDATLYNHLKSLNAFQQLPFDIWFTRCFASVIHEKPLEKIWDRLISGAYKVLAYVAVALLLGLRKSISNARSVEEILQDVSNISEETAEVISKNAIDLYLTLGHFVTSSSK